MTLSQMPTKTPAQVNAMLGIVREAAALAKRAGYDGTAVTEIHISDAGELASIELGKDADDMARIVLNFAL